MFCTSCGKQIPDGTTICPLCGVQIISTAPVAATQKSTSSIDVGGFFKSYFKNPIGTVSAYSKEDNFLWGMIPAAVYVFIRFLVYLINGYDAAYAFGVLFSDVIFFAAIIFGLMIFLPAFKLEKLSVKSIMPLVGLSFLPIAPAYLVGLIFDSIFDTGVYVGVFVDASIIFAVLLIFVVICDLVETKVLRAMLAIVTTIAASLFIQALFVQIVYALIY